MFRNPANEEIRDLLARTRTIAVVGLSPRPERPSHRIARRLQSWGYRVIPVRPAVSEVLGEKAYPRLADVPHRIDLVDVFPAARERGPSAAQCMALGLRQLWTQEGIVTEPAAERARAAGMLVVMGRCISVEYRRRRVPA